MSKIQAIRCKCGKTFAACLEPYCYEDADWHRDMRKYIKRGCSVVMLDKGSFDLQKCDCGGKPVNPNQQSLF